MERIFAIKKDKKASSIVYPLNIFKEFKQFKEAISHEQDL